MSIDLSKRAFFRKAGKKVSEVVVEQVEKKAEVHKVNWFRPPFALNELEFMLTCMRCSDCITACEFGVIFPLDESYGMKVAATPAMDLKNRSCQICTDWPCVEACTYGALKLISNETSQPDNEGQAAGQSLPKLANIAFDTERCLPFFGPECGFCASVCPIPGALNLVDDKPVVNQEKCVGCAQCREACVTDPSSIEMQLL